MKVGLVLDDDAHMHSLTPSIRDSNLVGRLRVGGHARTY